MRRQVEIPRSIPGLVTQRMLTMTFCEGTQITRLAGKVRPWLGLGQKVYLADKTDSI